MVSAGQGWELDDMVAFITRLPPSQVGPRVDRDIVNDPNDWGAETDQPRYIIDLVKRVTTVSVETTFIVGTYNPLGADGVVWIHWRNGCNTERFSPVTATR